jgi:hypothetical protein
MSYKGGNLPWLNPSPNKWELPVKQYPEFDYDNIHKGQCYQPGKQNKKQLFYFLFGVNHIVSPLSLVSG